MTSARFKQQDITINITVEKVLILGPIKSIFIFKSLCLIHVQCSFDNELAGVEIRNFVQLVYKFCQNLTALIVKFTYYIIYII